jgi:ParB family chromosome partitioning protein
VKDEIKLIPIDEIHILNPRARDPKKFATVVESIRNLGLKKPIQVSLLGPGEVNGKVYDLVYGQGRVTAYQTLGYKEIPAIVVDVPKEERLLRSLVENMARRTPSCLALMNEIERLKAAGYSNVEIGKKLDLPDTTVGGYLHLKKTGEERLLDAALRGVIPIYVAIEIAKADGIEAQRALLKAYESKQLNFMSIRRVKQIVEQRRFAGKQRETGRRNRRNLTSAESMVNAYRRESQKQKMMVKKAKLCEAKLVVLLHAFNRLLVDENFANLLRAESLATMPKYLSDKLGGMRKEAA